MQHLDSTSLVPGKSRIRFSVFAAVGAVAVYGAWFAFQTSGPARADQPREEAQSTPAVSSQELRELKASITRLDRKSSLLAAAVAASEPPVQAAEGSSSARPPVAEDTRTAQQKHSDDLSALDAALTADSGDFRERRASAEALRRELTAAAGSAAQVLEVECATAFCKAVLEQEMSISSPLNMNKLMDAAPSLKLEAMFGYQTEGTRKRTTIYAAREGQWLPLPSRANGDTEFPDGHPLPLGLARESP